MQSSFVRNLPLLLLAAGVGVGLFMMYRHLQAVESRLTGLTAGLTDATVCIRRLQSMALDEDAARLPQHDHVHAAPPASPSESVPDEILDEAEAESVDREDVEVRTVEREEELPTGGSHVQQYIGQLEQYLHSEDASACDDPDALPAPLDSMSDTASEAVSLSQLSRKRVPPWPAKTHPAGHRELFNGKVFEVIVTANGITRWGRPQDEAA